MVVQTDPVNHPDHYTRGKLECIDALAAATQGLNGMEWTPCVRQTPLSIFGDGNTRTALRI